ncbi:hypothetical protein [Sphingobacterium faecale]|uniref:AraC family transcriptional regulator n=1 Tax=Sphingobacterium faecale TaxID=2803775 RepID=A0ABS1R470_9SPHI|nr:hypothetical protein [Sphingobacterium faecale]MBL1409504.1 hypothetical protein [Sphingobacterium faecale]
MDENYQELHNTLMFYGVNCLRPFHISSGNPIPKFPQTSFRVDYYAVCICVTGQIAVENDNLHYDLSDHEFLM